MSMPQGPKAETRLGANTMLEPGTGDHRKDPAQAPQPADRRNDGRNQESSESSPLEGFEIEA